MSVATLDYEHRGQERRIHSKDMNHLLNTLFHEWHLLLSRVAPCLCLDSYCLPFHNDLLPCLQSNRSCSTGPRSVTRVADKCLSGKDPMMHPQIVQLGLVRTEANEMVGSK